MSSYYGAPPSSYSQQQPPPAQHQHNQQQPPYAAVSPVSAQSYSPSPPQAPLRPHTAAPYATSGYGPPPSATNGYFQQPFSPQQPSQQPYPPQPQQQQQQSPQNYGSPQQHPQQPRMDHVQQPPQQPPAQPAPAYATEIPQLANSHGLPPDLVQKLAEDLMRSIQSTMVPANPPPPRPPVMLSHPVPPAGTRPAPPLAAAPAPAPPVQQQPPSLQQQQQQQQQQPAPAPMPGAFPPSGPSYYRAPPPQQEPPQVPHHQYRQPQPQQPYVPQDYFPPQPAPPATNPPPTPITLKDPPPPPSHPQLYQHQPDALRRNSSQRQPDSLRRNTSQRYKGTAPSAHSHVSTPATSTSSGHPGKPGKMEDGSILFGIWGNLVENQPGKEPHPTEKLKRLLREIANYLIKEREPKGGMVVTPEKMVDFYMASAVEEDERINWKALFINRTNASLSSIYREMGCEHFYIPMTPREKPKIPALTPYGFETWMFTTLMAAPHREAARLHKVVASWPIHDSEGGQRFPKSIPRRCFPEKEDRIIYSAWWRVWDDFPSDYEDDDEDTPPLALPAPTGNSNGGRYYNTPPEQVTPPGPDYPAAAPMARNRTQQGYPHPQDLDDDELAEMIKNGKDKSALERHRKPYASNNTGNPGWKEELNPRPILGEEKPSSVRTGPPPSRPHTSHGHHPSRGGEIRDPRDNRDPRDARDARDVLESREPVLGRSKSSRRPNPRESSRFRRQNHRHSHSHHRGGGRRDRDPSEDRDQEWSGSSGVSAPVSAPDAGVPLEGRVPPPLLGPGPPPPAESDERARRNQRKLEEVSRVAREQAELLRGYGPGGRHFEPSLDSYEDSRGPPRRDDRRVAEYAYQDEYERDNRRSDRRSSLYGGGDRGRGRERHWGSS